MLKSLDVLIGISLVMLIVSMVVTLLTQFVTTAVNSHGRNLKIGLRELISHLDPGLQGAVAGSVADAVLKHPLIGGKPIIPFFKTRLGTIIHRDELTRILLELASADPWDKAEEKAHVALKKALEKSGIENVDNTLENIRTVALSLEESNPELASNVRADMAILQVAKNSFVGKINGWFDQTIDRVSERFTTSARAITFACGLILALALQLDTVNLLNTLWTNDAIRQQLVSEAADAIAKQQAATPNASPDEELKQIQGLATEGLIVLPWGAPAPPAGAAQQETHLNISLIDELLTPIGAAFSAWSRQFNAAKLPGILLSAFLLSLGAPFWYNSLKTLLRMRSAIADKDDAQRVARQSEGVTGPPPPDGTPAPAVPSTAAVALPGERGNLGAVG
jgi:hypothetical protein